MRRKLEAIDDTKKWLLSKERTPLEAQHLQRLMARAKTGPHQEPVVSVRKCTTVDYVALLSVIINTSEKK